MPGLRRETAIYREQPLARHIPYRAQIAANLVRTADGDYVQVFRLSGASFESADDADLNNWHERLNVLWRNIASPNVALWTHTIRRRVRTAPKPAITLSPSGTTFRADGPISEGFADALAS